MGLQLSWLEHTPDKGEVDSSSLFTPTIYWGRSSIDRAPDLHSGLSGSSPGLSTFNRQQFSWYEQRTCCLTAYRRAVNPLDLGSRLRWFESNYADMVYKKIFQKKLKKIQNFFETSRRERSILYGVKLIKQKSLKKT